MSSRRLAIQTLIQEGGPIHVEHHHKSIYFYSNKWAVKIFSTLEEGLNIDIEMRDFLTKKTHFTNFLPSLGCVQYQNQQGHKYYIADILEGEIKLIKPMHMPWMERNAFLKRLSHQV